MEKLNTEPAEVTYQFLRPPSATTALINSLSQNRYMNRSSPCKLQHVIEVCSSVISTPKLKTETSHLEDRGVDAYLDEPQKKHKSSSDTSYKKNDYTSNTISRSSSSLLTESTSKKQNHMLVGKAQGERDVDNERLSPQVLSARLQRGKGEMCRSPTYTLGVKTSSNSEQKVSTPKSPRRVIAIHKINGVHGGIHTRCNAIGNGSSKLPLCNSNKGQEAQNEHNKALTIDTASQLPTVVKLKEYYPSNNGLSISQKYTLRTRQLAWYENSDVRAALLNKPQSKYFKPKISVHEMSDNDDRLNTAAREARNTDWTPTSLRKETRSTNWESNMKTMNNIDWTTTPPNLAEQKRTNNKSRKPKGARTKKWKSNVTTKGANNQTWKPNPSAFGIHLLHAAQGVTNDGDDSNGNSGYCPPYNSVTESSVDMRDFEDLEFERSGTWAQ